MVVDEGDCGGGDDDDDAVDDDVVVEEEDEEMTVLIRDAPLKMTHFQVHSPSVWTSDYYLCYFLQHFRHRYCSCNTGLRHSYNKKNENSYD